MKASIRLNAANPYIEVTYNHRSAKSAAEDALELFFNLIENTYFLDDPYIPVATSCASIHSDCLPSESRMQIEVMKYSEFLEWVEHRKVAYDAMIRHRDKKIAEQRADKKDGIEPIAEPKVEAPRRRPASKNF